MIAATFFALVADARLVDRLNGPPSVGDGIGTGFAFQEGCMLRSGFSFANIGSSAECLPELTKAVPYCSDVGGEVTCMERGANDAYVHWNSREVNTTQGAAAMVSAGISAEGSGWGVSASASVKFTAEHQSASNAVSFYIGASGSFSINKIRNPSGLQLTEAAKYLIQQNEWDRFFEMYGTHYVSSIAYGGTFIGNVEIQSNSQANSFGISTAIKGSYGEGPFSVGGSAEFATKLSEISSQTTQTAAAMFTGGGTQTFNPQNPKEMGDTFNQWWANVQKPGHGHAFKMFLRPMTEIAELQLAVVKTSNKTIAKIFEMGSPSPMLLEKISKEWAMTNMELNTLKSIQKLSCYQKSTELQNSLDKIEMAMNHHLMTMQSHMTVPLLYKLGNDLYNGDTSWFKAQHPQYVYKKQIEAAVKATKVCDPGKRTCVLENYNMAYGNLVIPGKTNVEGLWNYPLRTIEECRAVCKTQPGCVAVVLQPKPSEPNWCWLKSAFTKMYPQPGFASEPLDCKCYDWNTNYVDPTVVENPAAASPEICQELCAQNSRCNYWTWTPAGTANPSAMCWMKPGKAGTSRMVGAVSGPKKCPLL